MIDVNALATAYDQLFPATPPKGKAPKPPANLPQEKEWFSNTFGSTPTTDAKGVVTQTPNRPSQDALVTKQGPTAYNAAQRANLGLDVQMGGQSPTSGMANVQPQNPGTPSWYNPVAAEANPLQALLGTYEPAARPVAPTPATPTPTTPKPTTPTIGGMDRNQLMNSILALLSNTKPRGGLGAGVGHSNSQGYGSR